MKNLNSERKVDDLYMATKSIIKNIIVNKPDKINVLIQAIERSINHKTKKETVRYETVSKGDIHDMFK